MTLDEVDLLDELEKILCSHKSLSSEEKDKLRQHGFIFSIGRALYNLSKENDDLRKRNQQLMEQMEEQAEVVDHDGDGSGTASGCSLEWLCGEGWGRGDGRSAGNGWEFGEEGGAEVGGWGTASGHEYKWWGKGNGYGTASAWMWGFGDATASGYDYGYGWGDGDGSGIDDE